MVSEQQKISCLLLAAGYSRRMGESKLDLPIGEKSMLAATAEEIAASAFHEKIIVVQTVKLVNPAFRAVEIGEEAKFGMHRSIRRGLEALEKCDAICIALADQPFLHREDYKNLLLAWAQAQSQGKTLLYPAQGEKRGNPAILHASHLPEIFAHADGDHGCNYLFRAHPERVYAWHTNSDNFFKDLDDPEAYEKWKNS